MNAVGDLTPHWLQRLGLVTGPEDTALRSAELSLRGLMPLWLAGLLLAVGAGLALYLYSRESIRLSLARRVVLALLRAALIGLVLVMLLRPVLLAEFHGERPRGIVVLLDTSQSMSQADRRVSDRDKLRAAIARGLLPATASVGDSTPLAGLPAAELARPARIDLVNAILDNRQLDLLARLGKKGPLQVLTFDRRLAGRERAGDEPAALKAEGSQTALADAIHDVLARAGGEPPAALVICTDGHDNASTRTLDEVAAACRQQGVALHFWGAGSSEGGLLQIKDVRCPRTVFIDEKPDVKDDPALIPVFFRCRGFKKGTLELTVKLGERTVRQTFPVQEGENLSRIVQVEPAKGKEGERPVQVSLRLLGDETAVDEVRRVVQVKNSRIKVLYVENTPRREYRFIQPALDRDRRVLQRLLLIDGDPRLAELAPDKDSGALFLDRFPDNFPDPHPRDPDRRPYDLLLVGDVPYAALGDRGARAVRQFVKEGGGLVLLAGREHAPAEYAASPLAEVLPVDVTRQQFPPDVLARLTPFKPALSYDGEQSAMLALDDRPEENVKLWKQGLWTYAPGFYWHYPVDGLKPGATSLVVHPEKQAGKKPDLKPMPLLAVQRYGKGEALFIGTDETWRWRDSTGDTLTARFWGQVVMQLGLPHLLGNAKRSQLDLERGEAVLGRPGAIKARLLDTRYEPLTRTTVQATLVNLDATDEAGRSRPILLRRVPGQPGEYRGALPNDVPGRHELRLAEGEGAEPASLPFRVELPPRHELEPAGLALDVLQSAAAASGGDVYREEDLHRLPDAVEARTTPFVHRQEILLWNPLTLGLFVLLITAEWLARKFSNLS